MLPCRFHEGVCIPAMSRLCWMASSCLWKGSVIITYDIWLCIIQIHFTIINILIFSISLQGNLSIATLMSLSLSGIIKFPYIFFLTSNYSSLFRCKNGLFRLIITSPPDFYIFCLLFWFCHTFLEMHVTAMTIIWKWDCSFIIVLYDIKVTKLILFSRSVKMITFISL